MPKLLNKFHLIKLAAPGEGYDPAQFGNEDQQFNYWASQPLSYRLFNSPPGRYANLNPKTLRALQSMSPRERYNYMNSGNTQPAKTQQQYQMQQQEQPMVYKGRTIPEGIARQVSRDPSILDKWVASQESREEADRKANAAMQYTNDSDTVDSLRFLTDRPWTKNTGFLGSTRGMLRNSFRRGGIKGVLKDTAAQAGAATTSAVPAMYLNQNYLEEANPELAANIKTVNDFGPMTLGTIGDVLTTTGVGAPFGAALSSTGKAWGNAVIANRTARTGFNAAKGFGKYRGQSGGERFLEGSFDAAMPWVNKSFINPTVEGYIPTSVPADLSKLEGKLVTHGAKFLNKKLDLGYGTKPLDKNVVRPGLRKALFEQPQQQEQRIAPIPNNKGTIDTSTTPTSIPPVVDTSTTPTSIPPVVDTSIQQTPTNSRIARR